MSMVNSQDSQIAKLERLVRNMNDRVKVLEKENRILSSLAQVQSDATLGEVIIALNKITNNLKRSR